ncbi:MAG: hypothetical protein AAGD10_13345 [Myxococcota bacterium]
MRISSLCLCLLAACGPDFTPAEEIDRLRVFGVRLEVLGRQDSVAWPKVDEDLRIELLATTESGDIGDIELSARFCPLAFQTAGDLECVFNEEDFEQLLLQVLPIPDELELDLDLDFNLPVLSSTVAVFNLEKQLFGEDNLAALEDAGIDVTPFIEQGIAAFCEQIQTQDFGDAVTRPDCNGTFDFRFDLVLNTPDERLEAIRQFAIIYDEQPPQLGGASLVRNRNPMAETLCARDEELFATTLRAAIADPTVDIDASTAITLGVVQGRCAFLEPEDDGRFGALPELDVALQTLSATTPISLFFDNTYALFVVDLCGALPSTPPEDRNACRADVDLVQALEEPFVDVPESLNLSWFSDTPSLDSTVTAFEFDNPDATLGEAAVNVFVPPRRIDFEASDEPLPLELFVVVRDGLGRGGRAFLRGLYTLRERPEETSSP